MKTKVKQLKVKIKSLAVESKIIRLEEKRAKKIRDKGLLSSLHSHRVMNVRDESRLSQLAYGFLRGRPYHILEKDSRKLVNWNRVEHLVGVFGETYDYNEDRSYSEAKTAKAEQKKRFDSWKKSAILYRESNPNAGYKRSA